MKIQTTFYLFIIALLTNSCSGHDTTDKSLILYDELYSFKSNY